jgi:hypothetical protein
MDKGFFLEQMERMGKVYTGYNEDKLKTYYEELKYMDSEKFKNGIDRLIQKRQGSFLPQVSEILHYCNTTRINSSTPEETKKSKEKHNQSYENMLKSYEKIERLNRIYSSLAEDKRNSVRRLAFDMMHKDHVFEGVYRIMFEKHYKFKAMDKLGIS